MMLCRTTVLQALSKTRLRASPLIKIPFRNYSPTNNSNNNNKENKIQNNNKNNNNGQVLGSIFDIDPNAKYAQPDNYSFDRNNFTTFSREREREKETEREGSSFLLYVIFGVNATIFALWNLDEYRDKIKKDFNIKIEGFDKDYMIENFSMQVKNINENKNMHTMITSLFSHQHSFHFACNIGVASCGAELINQNYIKPEMKKMHFEDKSWWYKYRNGYFGIEDKTENYLLGASGSIYGLLTSSVYFLGARDLIYLIPLLCFDGYQYWKSIQIQKDKSSISSSSSSSSYLSEYLSTPNNVSYVGHIGGALAGFILGFLLKTRVRI